MCETNVKNDLVISYIKWTKKFAKFHQRILHIWQDYCNLKRAEKENKNIKMVETTCSKCYSNNDKDAYNFSHIQDLCPSDRRRISLLIKHLAKCTREIHETKSDLAVSESEKKALFEKYQMFLNHHQCEKEQLELELSKAKTEKNTLKIQIIQALELLTCQLLIQEKQFINLVKNIRDLLCEKIIMHDNLSRKEIEKSNLIAKVQRLKETLRLEKLMHYRDFVQNLIQNKMIDKASQTTDDLCLCKNSDIRPKSMINLYYKKCNCNPTDVQLNLKYIKGIKTKSKNDLEELTGDGTLMRDLFFRKSNIEDNESLYLLSKLSKDFN